MNKALEKLSEILEEESEEAKEWQKIKEKARQYTKEQTDFDSRFIRFRTANIHTLFKLPRNCIDIILFLRGGINRDTGQKEKNGKLISYPVWGNLDKYYNSGFLVTARSQNYIADKLRADPAQISRSLKRLIELGYVKILGYEQIFDVAKRKYFQVTVFCLGVLIEGKEIYYHELGEEQEVKIEQDQF